MPVLRRQIVPNERRKPDGLGANLVQGDGKEASKTGGEAKGVIDSAVP